jgi:hypothetical protein|nr:MAG TPA: hypothetical protein [Caudoviricetes sp.]
MTSLVNGCNITLKLAANELTSNEYVYILPSGYTINTIYITTLTNVEAINRAVIQRNIRLVFPAVNSKSPSYITLYISDITKAAEIRFTIEKFGQIPDDSYFDNAFKPIVVTGDDGKKYNVIPSDQFK